MVSVSSEVLRLALIAVAAYAAFVAFTYVSQRSLLYPGAGGSAPPGPAWGEARTIETPDGERLNALHIAAPEGRSTILFFHGNADSIANHGGLARFLESAGYGILALSYRGYGGSTGSPSEIGLLADGLAAYDWLAERGAGPIVVMGQSLGSGVAVHTAARRPVSGVIVLSAYQSVLALAKSHYPYLPVAPLIKDSFRSDLWIAEVAQPKLFLHGARDDIVPLASARSLFELAGEPKTFRVYEDKGHNDLWSEETAANIVAFLEDRMEDAGT